MKNALVTGVSRGIGKEIAKKLHSEGYSVLGVYKYSDDYTEEKTEADSLAQELSNLTLIPCDLAQTESFNLIRNQVSDTKLDAVVNNAAEFFLEKWGNMKDNVWDRTLAVNLTAPLKILKVLDTNLQDGSAVVNIVSTDAFVGAYDTIAYGVAKAGLVNLTKSLSCIYGERGVRVNAVAPGWVETPMTEGTLPKEASYMTPLGRNAKPSEIADLIKYLLSDEASFVNGSIINCDGGFSVVDYTLKKEAGL